MNNGQEWVERLDGIFKISSPGNRYMAPPPPTKTAPSAKIRFGHTLRTTKHNCRLFSYIIKLDIRLAACVCVWPCVRVPHVLDRQLLNG